MNEKVPKSLPHPLDRPQADVVIFDGHCRFCRAQVEKLQWFDGGERLAFVSLHDPIVQERWPDLSYDQLMEQMYIVDQHGRRHGGAAAVRYLSRRLPRLWWLAPLMHIPFSLPIWQWMYRQVAKRRYKISQRYGPACEGDSCSLHFGDQSTKSAAESPASPEKSVDVAAR